MSTEYIVVGWKLNKNQDDRRPICNFHAGICTFCDCLILGWWPLCVMFLYVRRSMVAARSLQLLWKQKHCSIVIAPPSNNQFQKSPPHISIVSSSTHVFFRRNSGFVVVILTQQQVRGIRGNRMPPGEVSKQMSPGGGWDWYIGTATPLLYGNHPNPILEIADSIDSWHQIWGVNLTIAKFGIVTRISSFESWGSQQPRHRKKAARKYC